MPLSKVILASTLLNQRLLKCRHDRARFWLLFDGLSGNPVTDIPDMDMFRYDDHPLIEKYDVMPSIGDIKGRLGYNSFGESIHAKESSLYIVGSFFNQAYSPNVVTNKSLLAFKLETTFAKRVIAKGEELTTTYGLDKINEDGSRRLAYWNIPEEEVCT
jgi:SET domain